MSDHSIALQQRVQEALQQKQALTIQGSGSKNFLGGLIDHNLTPLPVIKHCGVVNYEPKELVITARAGTSLTAIQSLLAEQHQMLAFEPPAFSEQATLGGTIACGLSGPRRPYTGSARDFVLGSKIINGQAEILHFGGEVMKNVAGYDVSRLMVGAMGTLGLILELSLKVLPQPEQEISLTLECPVNEAIEQMNKWSATPLPISAACYDGANLYIRLSGAATAVSAGSKRIGGDIIADCKAFWYNVRELQHGFFNTDKFLWRLSLPSDTPYIELPGKQFIDWGGAQRWYIADTDNKQNLYSSIAQQGGQLSLFRASGDNSARNSFLTHNDAFHPLSTALLALHKQLKHAFDPQGIFNPGRLYREL